MMKESRFTSESVFSGHPDKVADQISDALLDAHLTVDPASRVACNTLVAKDLVVVAGEITSQAHVPYDDIVRGKLQEIGYDDASCGIDYAACKILTSVSQQSSNIADAVGRLNDSELAAGDQGMVFGYATDETPEFMPLGISIAHKIARKHMELRRSGRFPWLKPDGKTQVTVRYQWAQPVDIDTVVFSAHHSHDVTDDEIRQVIIREIIEPVIPEELRAPDIRYLVNPGGRFEIGGPRADTGLTGRKIIVDTYGGYCPHGGGAFSGKDPTKVDRSAAYMARYIAKNIVAAGLASRCTLQISYAIGRAEPVSLACNLHDTGRVDSRMLENAVKLVFPLKPGGIIDFLCLRRPIYQQTAVFGHFGRELPDFTWENTDKVQALRTFLSL